MILTRRRLRHAALRLAGHHWPVTPGARFTGRRFDCDRPGCPTSSCHPALPEWEKAASTDRRRVGDWWRRRPYAVLLITGVAFDAIEVGAPLGALALAAAGRIPGPVITTPAGRWCYLVRPGRPLDPMLADRTDIVLHTAGSWIPAPPTRLPEGPVRWTVSPAEVGWRLPTPGPVQDLLAGTLHALIRPDDPPVRAPGRLSTGWAIGGLAIGGLASSRRGLGPATSR